jgi:hypothetical protein
MARRPPVRLPALAAVHLRALSHQEMRAPAASHSASVGGSFICDDALAKYLFRANHVGKVVEGFLKEGGTKRREAVSKAISAVGGKRCHHS